MKRLAALDLLYPPACLLCHRRLLAPFPRRAFALAPSGASEITQVLCASCEDSLPRMRSPSCQRCGLALSEADDARLPCRHCRQQTWAFERVRAPLCYWGSARDALLAFKYHGRHRLGTWLAHEMARRITQEDIVVQSDVLVPVPRHWLKRRVRGAYPAEALAKTVSHLLQRPCDPAALRCRRWLRSQTRLQPTQRLCNVSRAFRATTRRVTGRRVLLIDDVLTSGATAQACAVALREAGAAAVEVLTAARAAPEDA
jgi:ComF family protein